VVDQRLFQNAFAGPRFAQDQTDYGESASLDQETAI
jgi:hypothetical protein